MTKEEQSKRVINIVILGGFSILFIVFMTITAFINKSNQKVEKQITKCIEGVQYQQKEYKNNKYYQVLYKNDKNGKQIIKCYK